MREEPINKVVWGCIDSDIGDGNYTNKDDNRIEFIYENSENKKEIDDIFISLCGYSLATILREATA